MMNSISIHKMAALGQRNDERPAQTLLVPIRWSVKLAKLVLRLACVLSVVASVTIVTSASAQFGRSNNITMEPGDWEKMKASVRAVLEEYQVGSRQTWKSDSTDRAGEALLVETFEKNGLRCAQVTHRFTAGIGGQTYTAPMCQVADGSWKMAF